MKVPGFSIKTANLPKPAAHPKAGIKTAKRQNNPRRPSSSAELIRKAYHQGDTSNTFVHKMRKILDKTASDKDHNFYL